MNIWRLATKVCGEYDPERASKLIGKVHEVCDRWMNCFFSMEHGLIHLRETSPIAPRKRAGLEMLYLSVNCKII